MITQKVPPATSTEGKKKYIYGEMIQEREREQLIPWFLNKREGDWWLPSVFYEKKIESESHLFFSERRRCIDSSKYFFKKEEESRTVVDHHGPSYGILVIRWK